MLGRIERGFYQLVGVDPSAERGWRAHATAMLAFNVMLLLLTYCVLRLQGLLPLNPLGYPGTSERLAFNTAISFTTNTNWQAMAARRRCRTCRGC